MAASCDAAAVGAELGRQPRVSAPRAVGVTDWGRPRNSGGNSSLSAAMLWVCGVERSGDKPRFAEPDQQMWMSPLFLIDPGNLFRGYNPDKHGPLDRRFGRSVANEIAKLIQKAQNRRKHLPSVPLASFDRALNQEPSQAFLRDEIMAKVGELGVAVFDCLRSGVSPSVLVGRVEFGSPSLYRVKKVRREVGELVH